MLKLNKLALLIFSLLMMAVSMAKADEVISSTLPTTLLTQSEARKLGKSGESFYKCQRIKPSKRFNPQGTGKVYFSKTAPAPDDNALDGIEDRKNKVYRCQLVEYIHETGKLKVVSGDSW